MFGIRRKARARALQLLYQREINLGLEPGDIELFWQFGGGSVKVRAFATELFQATTDRQEEIDRILESVLENWKLSRLSVVVRNLLRLMVCEMIILKSAPFQVVIDESVELAKRFMDEESAKFINSVLEKCRLAASDGEEHTPAPQGEAG